MYNPPFTNPTTLLTFEDLEIIGLVTKDVADALAHTTDPLTWTVDPFVRYSDGNISTLDRGTALFLI